MILNCLLMFACGAFTKLTDNLIDEPFKPKKPGLKLATGIAYGALAGYLATTTTEFATLIIAITIGVLLAGKIDAKAHQAAIATLIALTAILGMPQINTTAMTAFTGLVYLDEKTADYSKKEKKRGLVQKAAGARLSLETGTLALGILTGNFVYFTAILTFDLGYKITDKAMRKKKL